MKIMTRQEAIRTNTDPYFNGKPCSKGHLSLRRISGKCLECHRLHQMERYKNDPDKEREISRRSMAKRAKNNPLRTKRYKKDTQLKTKYGISIDKYEAMLIEQNYVCAICQEQCLSRKSLAVDHCHKTNQVRGLLCMNCNQGLGKFKDNINLLKKAIDYLK